MKEDTEDAVTMEDIGKHQIVVPIAMLKEHGESTKIRAAPVEGSSSDKHSVGSKTAAAPLPSKRCPKG